ncbi:hypothetical protein ACKF11_14555 [Methylobacillus sp. Pita2]|uniref:hypothetical protein n=1 Tax=Methylobacillus TaxID=404 RepID=UPI00285400F3|nr:hypothetical protein [Methylobacillus flagellatus]MDR5172870.1 hypothetical protein [Methylobacillus flagellatus]
MIDESTWHRVPNAQKRFVWTATADGIRLHHTNENASYVITWEIFHAILEQARNMAATQNGIITAGIHQSDPTPGSIGEWVLAQRFVIETGNVTPRHLSFLGPIFGRMGFIRRQISGNSIQWVFN